VVYINFLKTRCNAKNLFLQEKYLIDLQENISLNFKFQNIFNKINNTYNLIKDTITSIIKKDTIVNRNESDTEEEWFSFREKTLIYNSEDTITSENIDNKWDEYISKWNEKIDNNIPIAISGSSSLFLILYDIINRGLDIDNKFREQLEQLSVNDIDIIYFGNDDILISKEEIEDIIEKLVIENYIKEHEKTQFEIVVDNPDLFSKIDFTKSERIMSFKNDTLLIPELNIRILNPAELYYNYNYLNYSQTSDTYKDEISKLKRIISINIILAINKNEILNQIYDIPRSIRYRYILDNNIFYK
jgi:hypothetical protein